MAEIDPEELAQRALRLLGEGDPREARKLLMQAVDVAPQRADLLNALGTVQLQLGEPEIGRPLIAEAIRMATEQGSANADFRPQAEQMIETFELGLAAANEDLDEPAEALAAYDRVLARNPGMPRARQGRAHLLLAWGRVDEGCAELARYVAEDRDENPFIDGASAFLAEVRRFVEEQIHPREFLAAHRGSYVEFFDHHARGQEKLGWIAEAARMKRAPDGRVVPIIPEGARPYAAVRVDLVNPATSEVGQIGDQPMVVALAQFQTLARAPVAFAVKGSPFPLRISSQAPWDQLPVALLFRDPGALEEADAAFGDWYQRGWNGEFGDRDSGRFHYVSDPAASRGGRGVTWHVDLGRARLDAFDDLLRRLEALHARLPLDGVLVGRGHLG